MENCERGRAAWGRRLVELVRDYLSRRLHAAAVAAWLAERPKIARVNYPGLPSHSDHERARRYFSGFGGIIGFGIRGGHQAAVAFIQAVRLCSHLANIGDAKTLVLHPASTTHQQMTEEAQRACGVTPEAIRVAVGLENIADLKADFAQALQA